MTILPDLEAMDRTALSALWTQHLGGAVPRQMSQTMQRRFIAFAMQAAAEGDVPSALAARLDRIAAGEVPKAASTLKPGARLLRAWNGTTHVVDVVADGYLWNGTRHRSLSAIARAITGARWSGPRFFGVVEREGAASGSRSAGPTRTAKGANRTAQPRMGSAVKAGQSDRSRGKRAATAQSSGCTS